MKKQSIMALIRKRASNLIFLVNPQKLNNQSFFIMIMGKANPYVHIPKESWPSWTWYAIECVALNCNCFSMHASYNH